MSWSGDGTVAVDQMALRRHNLSLVLRQLREHGPRSRARLAAETGLNKATVSSLVAELTSRRLVRTGAVERGAVGRPGQSVELDGSAVCGIGAEVNVDHVAALVLNLRGEVVSERRVPLDTTGLGPQEVLDHVALLLAGTMDALAATGAQCAGITVGVAGLVDGRAGVVKIAPNLEWLDVPVAQLLSERLGQPPYALRIENEASLAAIAEAASGEHETRRRDLVVVFGGIGVGGGIVSGGQLLLGHRGLAGEVGHIPADPHGHRCGCGRTGCWETVVGLRALLNNAADRDDSVQDPGLPLEDRLAELDRRARLGDGRTLAALEQLGRWLGVGGGVLVNLLNPGTIVLGGYFSELATWLVPVMEREMAAAALAPEAGGCRVEASRLGLGAVTRGGALVALDAVFNDPTRVPKEPAVQATPTVGGTE